MDGVLDWLNAPEDKPWPPSTATTASTVTKEVKLSSPPPPQPSIVAKKDVDSQNCKTETISFSSGKKKSFAIEEVDSDDDSDNVDDEVVEVAKEKPNSNAIDEKKTESHKQQQQEIKEEDAVFSSEQLKALEQMNTVMVVSALIQLEEQEERCELCLEESDERATVVSLLMRMVFLFVREKEQSLIHDNNRKLIANDLISELVSANQTMRADNEQLVEAVGQIKTMFGGGGGGPAVAASSSSTGKGGAGAKKSLIKETF